MLFLFLIFFRGRLKLEKVGDGSAGRHRLLGLGHFVEEEEVAMKLFVELENGCHVATSVAVVGR